MTLKEAAVKIAALQTLLALLHDEFSEEHWTAADVFEGAAENGLIHGAIVACLEEAFTVSKLSRFLSLHCGPWGGFSLRCVTRHSRYGALFAVTKSLESVTTATGSHGSVHRT